MKYFFYSVLFVLLASICWAGINVSGVNTSNVSGVQAPSNVSGVAASASGGDTCSITESQTVNDASVGAYHTTDTLAQEITVDSASNVCYVEIMFNDVFSGAQTICARLATSWDASSSYIDEVCVDNPTNSTDIKFDFPDDDAISNQSYYLFFRNADALWADRIQFAINFEAIEVNLNYDGEFRYACDDWDCSGESNDTERELYFKWYTN